MFRSQSRSAVGRFSLLLLDEGEYYFSDHAAQRHLRGGGRPEGGRLRLLSHSVIFEPEDEAAPMVKLRFAAVRELLEHKKHGEWEEREGEEVPEPVPEDEPGEGGAAPPEAARIDDADFDDDAPELDPVGDEEEEDDVAEAKPKPKGRERKRRTSLEGGVSGMGKGFGKGLGKGMKGMGSVGKGLKGGVGKGLGAGLGAVSSGLDGVKTVGDMAKGGIKDSVGELSGATSALGRDSAIGGGVGKGVGKGFGKGLKAAKAARDAAMSAADAAASAAGAAADKTGVSAAVEKSGISGALAAGTDAALSAKSAAAQRTGLDGGLAGATSGLTNRFTSGVSGLTDLASAATELASGGLTSMTGVVGGVASMASGAMGTTVGKLTQDSRPTVAITFTCDNALLMKPHGKDQPYDIDRSLQRYTFTLVAPKADDNAGAATDADDADAEDNAQMAVLAPRIRQLYEIINPPAGSGSPRIASWMRPEALEELIASREAEIDFDTSSLIDAENETALFEAKAERVSPLVSIPGRVLLSECNLYFQPFNNAEGADDAVLSWSLQEDKGAGGGLTRLERRRHALRKTGAEMVFKAPRGAKVGKRTAAEAREAVESVFLVFGTNKEREDFIRLVCERTLLTDDLVDYEQKMRLRAEEWGAGKLSNYEYLMHLNSAAGRSINDIAQYPVMPWVIKDYVSDQLDLKNLGTFRDLSKPIGALQPTRLKSVTQRYEEMVSLNDPEMVPFMWGSHYSTAGYVLHYLAREAPDLMLKLQSGDFDKPDRLFSSVRRAWAGVLENSTDVKELIPEFYQPASSAFLTNHRGVDWGIKQDGAPVGDVELPPWAHDSEDFVKKMAEALECDYVSQHLHEWIDLIFGHKQQGEAAVAAGNLFHPLSYEGAIDIRTVTDPQERAATLTQINEFGQTPSQLFTEPHPRRSDAATEAGLTLVPLDVVEHDISYLDDSPADRGSKRSSVSSGVSHSARVHSLVDKSRQPGPKQFLPVVTDRESTSGSLECGWLTCGLEGMRCNKQFGSSLAGTAAAGGGLSLLAVCAAESLSSVGSGSTAAAARRLYGTAVDGTLRTFDLTVDHSSGGVAVQSRSTKLGSLALSAVCLTESDSVAIVGSWDNSIYVYSIVYDRIMERKEAHQAAVSALDLLDDTLISASWDGTIKVWKLRRGSGGRGTVRLELSMELDGDGHGGGHGAEVTCVAMATKRASSGKAYNGSKWACSGGSDGTFCVWCIDPMRTDTGALAKCYPDSRHPDIAHQGAVTAVAWTEDGCYAASAGQDVIPTVRLYCVRGTGVSALADVSVVRDVEPFTWMHSLRWIGDHLVAGGDEGGLEIWRLQRHEKLNKVILVKLADEVDSREDDSASMWASATEYHSGTTVQQVLPLLPSAARPEGGPGLVTVGDDGSIAVWTPPLTGRAR